MSEVIERTPLARHRHDTVSEHLDVMQAIEQVVADNLNLLAPLNKAWQPTDYLPDLESGSWQDDVERFRKAAEAVSDQLLVVLVGDMVTEEALPNYSVSLNGLVRDEEGDSPGPWARWLRGWTAEQNRHGDLLNAYLRLTGRVHMRAIAMLLDTIAMRGRFMDDGKDPDLFDHFAIVAQRTNVYTVRDYASIIEHLVQAWDIAGRSVTGEAARAQEELCREAERYVRLAERTAAAIAKQPLRAFSWIRERAV
jgi:fatty acid desaturase